MNRSSHPYKLEDLYAMVGISRQAHFKRVQLSKAHQEQAVEVIESAKEIRKRHSRMGCRKMYYEIRPESMGRDKTERILLDNGFRVGRPRSYHRTTYAGSRRYDNLVDHIELSGPNQLWVSDITYLPIAKREHLYLTLILDVYSKVIKGWSLSRDMTAENTVVHAYKSALRANQKSSRTGLIFHSDRGSQYGSLVMAKLHEDHNVRPSMGGKAWENPHAESLNGILKGEYITTRTLQYKQVDSMVKNAILKYNKERPHGSINRCKPLEYEHLLHQLADGEKTILKVNYVT